jgi:hypothetical protein
MIVAGLLSVARTVWHGPVHSEFFSREDTHTQYNFGESTTTREELKPLLWEHKNLVRAVEAAGVSYGPGMSIQSPWR